MKTSVRSRPSRRSRFPAYGIAAPLALTAGLTIAAAGAAVARPIKLVAFGDSLTAGFRLPRADGFAAKLQDALRRQGHDVTVVDGGVSGDTTTGGLARLDWTLGSDADAVILELGANDMLRGINPKVPKANLDAMLSAIQARHIPVLLAGMRASPSLGKDYATAFDSIYAALAKKHDVALYPFFLQGIIGDPGQHLDDGVHPNAKGVDTIVANILPAVDGILAKVKGGS